MTKGTVLATALFAYCLTAAATVHAGDISEYADADDKTLEQCLQAALDMFGGEALNVEYKFENGDPIYDFDILGADGVRWEVEVNAENAMIWEIEREVDASDPMFANQVKVSEEDAVAGVLQIYPGSVESVEYGIESDGSAAYEIDVVLASGGEMNIEVDAASGKITEANPELWEIGEKE